MLYCGRHEPIVSKEMVVCVQEVLNQRNRTCGRDIIHLHYMKGTLICGECRDERRRTRLLFSQNGGNGGIYEYSICATKERRICTTPASRVEAIEAELESAIDNERMSLREIEEIRERARTTVA
jgi:site-specific DNA recombinase